MRIVIVGAGGLGSYVGAVLSRAGHDVFLVARGEHRAAIEREGLRIHDPEGDFVEHLRCVESAMEAGDADVAFVAVKSFSLLDVAAQIGALAAQGALVVPLLNGVDTTDRLRALGIPSASLVDGIAYFTAFRTGPGQIERKGKHQRLVIGSLDGESLTQLEKVADAFADTSVEVEVADNIGSALWSKMAVVCSLAAICGITGSPIGPIRAHPLGGDLQKRAIAEVFAVGRACDVQIPKDAELRVGDILDAFPEDFYPSVLHDLKSGRPTEMESLGGVISRLGRQLGVETPLYDAATCVVQIMETRGASSA
jgi:2-dehydropantoate 2-reductase